MVLIILLRVCGAESNKLRWLERVQKLPKLVMGETRKCNKMVGEETG